MKEPNIKDDDIYFEITEKNQQRIGIIEIWCMALTVLVIIMAAVVVSKCI